MKETKPANAGFVFVVALLNMVTPDNLFFGLDFNPEDSSAINFIENRLMDLSPFSAHQIEIWGETFATFEHAYQCARLKKGSERDAVKNTKSPLDAWREGQKYKNTTELLVENYDKDAVVEELFRAKLAQHPDILKVLQATGSRELLKVYPTDYYWGTGADGTGENKMGKLWMKIRDELL